MNVKLTLHPKNDQIAHARAESFHRQFIFDFPSTYPLQRLPSDSQTKKKNAPNFSERSFLYLTLLAFPAEKHCDSGETDGHVDDVFEPAIHETSEKCVDEVPLEESHQAPIDCPNPHQHSRNLMNTTFAFGHHTVKKKNKLT